MDTQLAPPESRAALSGDGSVVWRRWRVVPASDGPLLTGLLGFPWRDRTLEARCVASDPSDPRSPGFYHRVVPAAGCTCGIYAGPDDFDASALPPGRIGEPSVEGFVMLGGHVIRTGAGYRAQMAEIVGPLVLSRGRTSPWSKFARSTDRSAVAIDGNRYRVVMGRKAEALADSWSRLAGRLRERYSCSVIVGGRFS